MTQGRSAGLQVQAISRSGSNTLAGSLYGFFQSDKFTGAQKGIVLLNVQELP